MDIKNLEFIDKSKKMAFLFCAYLVTIADGVITDEEKGGILYTALEVLKLEKKDLEKLNNFSSKDAEKYVKEINKSSVEELTLLGVLMGVLAKIDGSVDKTEKEMIKNLLTVGGLNESTTNVIIKSLSGSKKVSNKNTSPDKKIDRKNKIKGKSSIDTDDTKNLGEFIDAIVKQFSTLKLKNLIDEGAALLNMVKSQYDKLSETISGIGLDFFMTYFANLTEEDGSLNDQEKKYLHQAIFEGKKELATMVDNLALFKTSRLDETFEYLNDTRMEAEADEIAKNIGLLFFYHFLLGVVFCSIKGNTTKSRKNVLEKYLFLDLKETKKIFNIYKMLSPLNK
jgi:tellurite resistance protein